MKKPRNLGLLVSFLAFGGILFLLTRSPEASTPPRHEAAGQSPFLRARSIESAIATLESKVWKSGEDLSPSDFHALRGNLASLEECREGLRHLREFQERRTDPHPEEVSDLSSQLAQVEVWILDVRGLVDQKEKPPDYGGIAIPRHLAATRFEKVRPVVIKILKNREAILLRDDPREKEELHSRLKEYLVEISICRHEYSRLIDLMEDGWKASGAGGREPAEIDSMRDDWTHVLMLVKQAHSFRSELAD